MLARYASGRDIFRGKWQKHGEKHRAGWRGVEGLENQTIIQHGGAHHFT